MSSKRTRTTKSSRKPKRLPVYGINLLTRVITEFPPETRSFAMPVQASHLEQAWKRPDGWVEFTAVNNEKYETADVLYEPVDYWSGNDLAFVEGSGGYQDGEWWTQFIPVRILGNLED